MGFNSPAPMVARMAYLSSIFKLMVKQRALDVGEKAGRTRQRRWHRRRTARASLPGSHS